MQLRKYSEFKSVKEAAAIIASEVIRFGKSEGWAGSFDDLKKAQDTLADFNIAYVPVDDTSGKWAYCRARRTTGDRSHIS